MHMIGERMEVMHMICERMEVMHMIGVDTQRVIILDILALT